MTNKLLKLPMGKGALDGIKAKLAAVEKDIAANEAIALGTDLPAGEQPSESLKFKV